MKTVMLLLVSGMLLVSCTGASTPAITQVVAFGDVFVDTGNGLQLSNQAVEAGELTQEDVDMAFQSSWEGRQTNGPVAVETLASKLNASLKSYGVNAARSDYGSNWEGISVFQNTGLLGQVDQFIADLDGKKPARGTLIFIVIGAFDLQLHLLMDGSKDDQTIEDLADQTIANLSKAVTSLAGAGAKRFMVVNTLDLARLPATGEFGLVHVGKTFQDRLVAQMPVAMEALAQQLKIEIQVFDLVAAQAQIRKGATEYGITELSRPCYSDRGPCYNPEKYYWWDGITLSARVHEILGEMMAAQISK